MKNSIIRKYISYIDRSLTTWVLLVIESIQVAWSYCLLEDYRKLVPSLRAKVMKGIIVLSFSALQ